MVNTERIELYCIEICIAADGLLACPSKGVSRWCGQALVAVVSGRCICEIPGEEFNGRR